MTTLSGGGALPHRIARPGAGRALRSRPGGRSLAAFCHLYGNIYGMRATIDKAGRLVIPKPLRDRLGLVPGEVEVTPDGAGLHIEPLTDDRLEDENGLLVIPA